MSNNDKQFMIEFGERLKQKRIEAGLTQAEVAERLGYSSKVSVCHIENGKRSVNADQVVLLANMLNTTVDYLMDGDNYYEDEAADIAQEILDNSELRFLFDAARDVDAETLKTVRQMLLILKRNNK